VPLLEQVLEKNPETVKVVFKNFPIRSHRFAMQAARTAMAAGRIGKFWEVHDRLFQNYRALNASKVSQILLELEIDEAALKAHIDDPAIQIKIQQDLQAGLQMGVRGTPTVFINGKLFKGQRSPEGFQQVVDAELAGSKKAS
jgi:protein-disulfide isomerase